MDIGEIFSSTKRTNSKISLLVIPMQKKNRPEQKICILNKSLNQSNTSVVQQTSGSIHKNNLVYKGKVRQATGMLKFYV